MNDPVMRELAQNLHKLYEKNQPLSYKTIERALMLHLGDETPTDETIRSYHLGKVSRGRANVMWIAAICDFYDVKVADVSPYFAERAEGYKGVLTRSSCNVFVPGQELVGAAA